MVRRKVLIEGSVTVLYEFTMVLRAVVRGGCEPNGVRTFVKNLRLNCVAS